MTSSNKNLHKARFNKTKRLAAHCKRKEKAKHKPLTAKRIRKKSSSFRYHHILIMKMPNINYTVVDLKILVGISL